MARTKNRSSEHRGSPRNVSRWTLGEYIRLSKEDIAKGEEESDSIVNQKRLLDEYYSRHLDDFQSVETYVDDGFTGTDTNREGFQKLIKDVTDKKINCVIVKDLSRLSRNYSDAGSLIENLFVRMNVRFISLGENVDSYKNPDSVSNMLVPITNVMNDNFCYQTSKKIRQVFDYKRRNGEHIGSFAAYGYIKSPMDKNTLIVDAEAAAVVRSIYSMFLQGMSKNAIARNLNEQGILCPSKYKHSKGLKYQNPGLGSGTLWSAKTVTDVLKNRLYIGDMVQGRQRIRSYKVHTQESVPEEEWFIAENTHQPIVGKDTFEKVRELLKRDTRSAPMRQEPYLFSGFLRCADCKKAMTRSEVKGRVYYYCRTYKDQSKSVCEKHTIRHEALEEAVLYSMRLLLYLTAPPCPDDIIKSFSAAQKSAAFCIDGLIAAKEKELSKILRYKQAIYEDWKDGKISGDDYRYMNGEYEAQVAAARAVIANLLQKREEEKQEKTKNPFPQGFTGNGNIERLTREILIEFVDYIEVYKNGDIQLKFRFADGFGRINVEGGSGSR